MGRQYLRVVIKPRATDKVEECNYFIRSVFS